jgi:Flp pilus assembly protein CpaB
MVEETTRGIENKWLLVIAMALGVIVAVIYNVHINAVRAQQKGRMIEVIELVRDLEPGDRIEAKDITRAEIPRAHAEAFGKVVRWEDRPTVLARGGKAVNQTVMKGEFLLWSAISGSAGSRASAKLSDGMVARALEFDDSQSLGDLLSPNDTVNLLGVFSLRGGQPQTYRIISGVRVLNVGGVGAADEASPGGPRRNYRKITIEVSPEVSIQLNNLMTHLVGPIRLELNKSSARLARDAGRINPQLTPLAQQARTTGSRTARPRTLPQPPR